MKYKVWVEIEVVDDNDEAMYDESQDLTACLDGTSVAEFTDEQSALDFGNRLQEVGEKMAAEGGDK